MEKEDVDKLMEIAARSRLHGALVGVLLLFIGIVFVCLGAHAIVLEITVTGILMIVFGTHTVLTKDIKSTEGIPMIILGILFVVLVYLFETLHGIILFLQFLSPGIISLAAALGYKESKRGRKISLIIAVVSLYVAINLFIAHEESMDILITLMGVVLIGLSVFVLWCVEKNKTVTNPLPSDEE
ncbi:MAG: hypothetical protein J5897_04125 [Candidatus Methanomethylophilus sp.]|nr:hypothetical protein [Methanomethylophilus sp.]